MTVEFRHATPADEPFLEEMLGLAIGWRDGSRAAMSPETEKYVRGFGGPGDLGLVAVSAGAGAGAAWYRLLRAPDRGYGHVRDDIPELALAVQPHARGAGIATGLLSRLLEHPRTRRLPGVSLSVDPDNPARRLYERLGFVKVGEVESSWTMLRSTGG